ncbi:NAD(P)/FAD-dependent oxidoreductase [Fictibacillus phosphorivorans]|uniref:NAD(P)/FAD-dependent oxidoreductase n=1 Tax=Fictibacillus phosphorivorans TaxID=1221500 RepID=UPI00203F14F0|nr:NAD(P)/FAD-dependent oxidoreductase [Fictibacillus phosphorivorans]MCM3718005.1 NAD(P)/FAD-dependent oxidoreductase [Fictibacillus phosphorivorans]MCM3775454.1 NAD(P)/FAD-dependent oxidoreductase [Fictibacillus phosphorivorans]
MIYDCIVIGGGPSGLMASVGAASNGARVLLIDKGEKLGRKLAISGGGRCNVTNRLPVDEIIRHIPGNGRFLYSAFSVFNNEDIISFFEGLGIKLKEEDHGRMFPVSNKATDVVQALLNKIKEIGVKIRTNTPVKTINYKEELHEVILQDGDVLKTKSIVIAVGGKSVPHTGSTGDGYVWAKKAGHTITELYPTEVPITSNESFIKKKTLQGISLRNVALSVWNPKGKMIKAHQMDMLFTHFGVSGPAALRCSQYVVKALKKFNVPAIEMRIDTFPEEHEDALLSRIQKRVEEEPKKAMKNVLRGMLPEKYLLFLIEQAEIDGESPADQIPKQSLRHLAQQMKGFSFQVNGTLSIEKAFVTGGGVSVKEIAPQTMASKFQEGLFFCGEILDLHGYTGGYNITVAFVTGHIAGTNAAYHALG